MSDPATASYQFERVGDFDGNGFYDAVRVVARADGTPMSP